MDISKPDGTGTLKVTRLTLDEDSMSCDFEGQVEGAEPIELGGI